MPNVNLRVGPAHCDGHQHVTFHPPLCCRLKPQRCATPQMTMVGGAALMGPYKRTRRFFDSKSARVGLFHLEMPMFRLFLDNPATTPPAKCRTVVGFTVEDDKQREEISKSTSNLSDLCVRESHATHPTVAYIPFLSDASRGRFHVCGRRTQSVFGEELGGMSFVDEVDPTMAVGRSETADEDVVGEGLGSIWVPPSSINFQYLQFAVKSCLSPWFISMAADAAFQHAVRNYSPPHVQCTRSVCEGVTKVGEYSAVVCNLVETHRGGYATQGWSCSIATGRH